MQSQVRFNQVPERVPEKDCFGAEACQVQQDSGEGTGEGLGGATSGSKRVPEVPEVGGLWCRARSGSTGFRRRFWRGSGEGLGGFGAEAGHVQQGSGEGSGEGLGGFVAEPGQVQQGSEEGLGGFGAAPNQVQHGSGEGSGRSGRLWCRARSGSTGFRRFR